MAVASPQNVTSSSRLPPLNPSLHTPVPLRSGRLPSPTRSRSRSPEAGAGARTPFRGDRLRHHRLVAADSPCTCRERRPGRHRRPAAILLSSTSPGIGTADGLPAFVWGARRRPSVAADSRLCRRHSPVVADRRRRRCKKRIRCGARIGRGPRVPEPSPGRRRNRTPRGPTAGPPAHARRCTPAAARSQPRPG